MEGDVNAEKMENIPLSEERGPPLRQISPVPSMGGTAISNPMAPAFPSSGTIISKNTMLSHHYREQDDVRDQNRPKSLPEHRSAIPHSYSAPNNVNTAVMSPVSLASPSENGASVYRSSYSKMDSLRSWSLSTYKCTKQLISEKFGKSTKTVDTQLELQIEALRDTQRKYSHILRLARALSSHFYHVVQTQHQLGDAFADLSQKSPELQNEFIYNSETQRTLTKNGETLLQALNFFVSSVNTLCNKTMEDTLLTIKQYEQARIEYDAYRTDLEAMNQQPRAELSSIRLEETQRQFQTQKTNYDQLRADVSIKLKFLEENKVKVMHKQLLLFHNAIAAYFTGNETALESTMKQFSIKMNNSPNVLPPSWLEQTAPETFDSIFGSRQPSSQ